MGKNVCAMSRHGKTLIANMGDKNVNGEYRDKNVPKQPCDETFFRNNTRLERSVLEGLNTLA